MNHLDLDVLHYFCSEYARKHQVRLGNVEPLLAFHVSIQYNIAENAAGGPSEFGFYCKNQEMMVGNNKVSPGYIRAMCWAFDHGVVDYVNQNLKVIEEEMIKDRKKKLQEPEEDEYGTENCTMCDSVYCPQNESCEAWDVRTEK
jgi:hypothetical protein